MGGEETRHEFVRGPFLEVLRRSHLCEVAVLHQSDPVTEVECLGEIMCHDALTREESCGAHFREEYQEQGEAKRDDDNFSHVAAWAYQGDGKTPERLTEKLEFECVKQTVRNYK